MSVLRSALLLVRDITATRQFLEQGLKLPLMAQSSEQQLLFGDMNASGADIIVKEIEVGVESPLSVGYWPMLTFEVQNFDETMYRLIEHGAKMDGAVTYDTTCKTAVLRAPDGFMLSIYEDTA
eukprot:TRINITY_DN27141_c0_g1_i1.p1 TRINITY_DN27141_c0_g1~~TRINITY_DN27141_c0_g1_i1.p1  ORF type:complete len:123 (+),score=16.61 TRINITY_DN27141_c0_g1_i1:115-483(+)